jgi:Protein of unknown function (DUF1488)
MPLTRLNEGYSVDLEGIAFGMLSETDGVVRCLVTDAAMADAMRGNPTQAEQVEWFRENRSLVEAVASVMFDEGRLANGIIRVVTRDLNREQFP